jgi:protein TonB
MVEPEAPQSSPANFRSQVQSWLTRRTVVLALVVVFHIVVIYIFATEIGNETVTLATTVVQTRIIDEPKREDPLPTLPRVSMIMPNAISVPTPLVRIQMADPPTMRATDIPPQSTVAVSQPQPVHESSVVASQFVHAVDLRKYYPSQSKRFAEQGVVQLQVCVNANGKYDGPPKIMNSSGYERLDEAGIKMVLDNEMRPATIDGTPVHSCKPIFVEFNLPD